MDEELLEHTRKLTRKEKRALRQTTKNTVEQLNFTIKKIEPLTQNQQLTFQAYQSGKNLLLTGTAGTGKSFLSIYLGLRDMIENEQFKQMVIVRSVVSTREMGFLPGNSKEKAKVYEAPYYGIFSEIFGRGDAYDYMKQRGLVEFISTSFVRGITINNAIIIVDEIQNMTSGELHSVFTRIGKNCKVVFAGDFKQNDLATKKYEPSGFSDFIKVLRRMKQFMSIEFNRDDIVRSALVRDYIVARELLEEEGLIEKL